MKFASALALLSVALLAGCAFAGTGDSDSGSATVRTVEAWGGPPRAAANGTLPVAEFNAYAATLPDAARQPRALAIEYLRPRQPYSVDVDTRPGGATVTVLRENLEDDSVRAERHVLEFALVSGGSWRLSSAQVAYRCHQGRGHQEFTPQLCL